MPTSDVRPTPDPTVLTTEALGRGLQSERDYTNGQLDVLRERLSGIDRATEVLDEKANRFPTDVQKEVGHLRELMDERFNSVQTQFTERDTRGERESRDNTKAVDAAFAAQKEAAAKQDETNAKAIDKSEKSTAETIIANAVSIQIRVDALSKSLEEAKNAITRIDSHNQGGRDQISSLYVAAALIALILGIVSTYVVVHP